MKIGNNGIKLIKNFEGLELKAYYDIAGVLTIGYGWTNKINGKDIYPGMTITEQEAERLLRCGLVKYEEGVNSMLKVKVNQNQYDALVSFAYNLGVSALRNSTLMKKLNAGDFAGASDEFPKWNRATINGIKKSVAGLTRRRLAEQYLFNKAA